MNVLITNRCNGSCQYCFLKENLTTHDGKGEDITLENFQQVLKYAHHLIAIGVTDSLNIMGGEPTLHPQFIKIFKMALTYMQGELAFIPIKLFSNGLFPQHICNVMKEEACPVMVNVNHPTMYSQSDWQLLTSNLAALTENNGHEYLISLSLNIDRIGQDYDYLISLAKQCNIHHIRVDLSRPGPEKNNTFIDVNEIHRAIPSLLNFISKCHQEGIQVNTDCCFPICSFSNEQLQDFKRYGVDLSFSCSGGIDVTPDLQLWHCAPLRHVNLGKLTDYTDGYQINAIIANKTNHLRWDVETFDTCKNCKWWTLNLCQGGCISFKHA